MDDQRESIKADDLPSNVVVTLAHEKERYVWKFKCGNHVATVGIGMITIRGKDLPWATVYRVECTDGEIDFDQALILLHILKDHFAKISFDFGYSFAETAKMKGILYRLKIVEREGGSIKTYKKRVAGPSKQRYSSYYLEVVARNRAREAARRNSNVGI